jgi:phosphatidylglycerophosphate synthase
MKPVDTFLDAVKALVRRFMRVIARGLNRASGGRISPNAITLFGLLMHVPVAWLISQGYFGYAALGLVVFGLLDALDGQVAQLQNRAGAGGMFLDSITDRMKEIILYIGIGYILVDMGQAWFAVIAIAACGGSVLTTYVNAWGEVAMASLKLKDHVPNQAFRGGLMRFEVRMFFLVIALLGSWLEQVVVIIAVLAWLTALTRAITISRKLTDVQN